jgi:hypothetical protein
VTDVAELSVVPCLSELPDLSEGPDLADVPGTWHPDDQGMPRARPTDSPASRIPASRIPAS